MLSAFATEMSFYSQFSVTDFADAIYSQISGNKDFALEDPFFALWIRRSKQQAAIGLSPVGK